MLAMISQDTKAKVSILTIFFWVLDLRKKLKLGSAIGPGEKLYTSTPCCHPYDSWYSRKFSQVVPAAFSHEDFFGKRKKNPAKPYVRMNLGTILLHPSRIDNLKKASSTSLGFQRFSHTFRTGFEQFKQFPFNSLGIQYCKIISSEYDPCCELVSLFTASIAAADPSFESSQISFRVINMAAQNLGSVVHSSLELETNDGSPLLDVPSRFMLSASAEQPDRGISNENPACRVFFRGRFLNDYIDAESAREVGTLVL